MSLFKGQPSNIIYDNMGEIPIKVPIPILDKSEPNSFPNQTKETPQPKKPFFSYMYEKQPTGGLGIASLGNELLKGLTILIGAFIVYKVLDISIKKK